MPRATAVFFVLALLLCGVSQAVAAQTPQQSFKVLIVQSYNPEYVWTQYINQGVRDGLQGLPVSYDVLYMDAKRKSAPDQLRARAQEALAHIEKQAPDVVVTVDDAAQAYLAVPFLKDRKTPQVVFCGVNAPLRLYGFPASNVSGVRERWHYREGFSLLQKIVPSVRNVAFLVDASESAGYVVEDLLADKNQIGPFALELAGVENIKTFQEWQGRILHYQTHADSLALGLYNSLVDETTGKVVPPDEVMAWTNSVNTRPTLGFSDIAKDHGLLCGVLESGHEQGFLAGQMARELLTKGGEAGTLPVRVNVTGVILVNLRTAEKLGARVPYGIIAAAGVVVK